MSDIEQFYDLLGHKEQTEIRALKLDKNFKPLPKEAKSIYVSSKKEFVETCEKLNGKYNLYAGLNERSKNGTNAKDVISVKRIFQDIDCINKPATEEDLNEAIKVCNDIVLKIEEKTGNKPYIIFSGNGYQLVYSIPEIKITESNREETQNQIQQFTKDLIKKFSNDKVKLDNVGDLPRIIRITGTTNIKGNKVSKFLGINKEENSKLKDYILSLKPETIEATKVKVGKLETSLMEILEKDEKIKNLFEGNIKGFVSRSEAEQSLICHLVGLNLDKAQIFKVMGSCKIGKWNEANVQYRNLTYQKALEIIDKKKKEKIQKEVKEVNSYNDIPINPEIKLNINSLIFEGIEKINLSPLKINRIYRIFNATLGKGHSKIFIITNPNENLNQGFQDLRLRKIDFNDLYKSYCKEKDFLLPNKKNIFNKETIKKYAEDDLKSFEIFEKEFEKHKSQTFFYEKIEATTNSSIIKAIKNFGFEKLLNNFIFENGSIDNNLYYVFRIGMLNFGNEYHKEVSKYNNHNLIITNTKTGKTTQLEKQTELKYDSATGSRLLGYSTGERSFEGDIQQQYKQIVLDDFSSANYQKEILDCLPSILENGKSLIGKGKKKILTECSSTFTLTTNSNKAIGEQELVLEFSKILNKLSETPQRIGSRFACVLFGNDFEEAITKDFILTKKEIEINKFLVKQIFEILSEFLITLKENLEIEKFLETKNSKWENLIQNISKNEKNFYGELRDFWESTKAGDRHHRGFALKQGVIDFFLDNEEKIILLIENKLELTQEDKKKIIKLSEENLERLNDLNFQSLRNIIKAQKSEAEYNNLRFKDLTLYVKELINATYKLIIDKPKEREKLIPFSMLNDYLDKNNTRYSNQARLLQAIPKKYQRINRDLKIFHMELLDKQGVFFIQTHKGILDNAYKLNTKEEE